MLQSKICIDSIRALVDQVLWRLLSFILPMNSIFVDRGLIFFSWVHRETNLTTHELAKWSCSYFYFDIFGLDHYPPSIVDVIVKETGLFM